MYTNEEQGMYSYSDNIEIKINDKVDKFIQELFETFLSRYRDDLKQW